MFQSALGKRAGKPVKLGRLSYASVLETAYRCPEDVIVMAVVILELRLSDVQGEVLGRNLVVAANDGPLEQTPEALNRVRVDSADNVLLFAVNHRAVREMLVQMGVTVMVIGRQQGNLIAANEVDELFKAVVVSAINHTGHHVAFTLNSANDNGFPRAGTLLVFNVPVAVITANIGFVHFHDTHQLAKLFVRQPSANAVTHVPSGLVAAKAHRTHDLEGANAFFGSQHHVNDPKPVPKIFVGVLENGPGDNREPVALRTALMALPMEGKGQGVDLGIAAARAFNGPRRPAVAHQIGLAGLLGGEGGFPLGNGHLVDFLPRSHGHFPSRFSEGRDSRFFCQVRDNRHIKICGYTTWGLPGPDDIAPVGDGQRVAGAFA
jgi:hypothetical protein